MICCAWLQYPTQVGHIQGGNVEYPVNQESHTAVTLTASLLSAVCYILRIIITFGLYQRPSSEENETNSSSGSCHGSYVM